MYIFYVFQAIFQSCKQIHIKKEKREDLCESEKSKRENVSRAERNVLQSACIQDEKWKGRKKVTFLLYKCDKNKVVKCAKHKKIQC